MENAWVYAFQLKPLIKMKTLTSEEAEILIRSLPGAEDYEIPSEQESIIDSLFERGYLSLDKQLYDEDEEYEYFKYGYNTNSLGQQALKYYQLATQNHI